ncbi:hypothetical protein BGZ75_000910, partial [Mortierella antarctica]
RSISDEMELSGLRLICNTQDDLALLHNYNFLTYLHSRFFGVQCLYENTNEKHPTWANIADIIEATSEIDLSKASAGFSLLPSR